MAGINKSSLAREFWRNIFQNNSIDLRNSDARRSVVNDFLDDPSNQKLGWNKTTDKRFFRLALDKVSREFGTSTAKFGIKPEPKRIKKQAGSMNFSVKTDEKPMHKLKKDEKPQEEDLKSDKKKLPNELTSAKLQQQQQAIAMTYTGASVGVIFETVFNILHSRFPACSPLSRTERDALGEAWFPIFNEYLSGEGSKWIMPAVITAPIVLVRVSELQRARKAQEIAETYGMPPEPNKKEDKKKKDKWSDRL